jgi:hypothetical protein
MKDMNLYLRWGYEQIQRHKDRDLGMFRFFKCSSNAFGFRLISCNLLVLSVLVSMGQTSAFKGQTNDAQSLRVSQVVDGDQEILRSGRVFYDVNGNNLFDENEKGIANVRLAAFSGELVETDENGEFKVVNMAINYEKLQSGLIFRLDPNTLPECDKVISENPMIVPISAVQGQTKFYFDFPVRPAIRKDNTKRIIIGHVIFPGRKYEVNPATLADINAKVLPHLREKDFAVKIRISELADNKIVRIDNREYEVYTLSQFKARMFGDSIMRQLKIPLDDFEYVNSEIIEDYDKKIAEYDDKTKHKLRIEIIKTPKPGKAIEQGCDNSQDATRIKSMLFDAFSARKPVETLLTDKFFKSDSEQVRNTKQLHKLISIIESRGGAIVLSGEDENLDNLRVNHLRQSLPEGTKITAR